MERPLIFDDADDSEEYRKTALHIDSQRTKLHIMCILFPFDMADTSEIHAGLRRQLDEVGIPEKDATELAALLSYGSRFQKPTSEQQQRIDALIALHQDKLPSWIH